MQLNKVSAVGGKIARLRFAIGMFVVGVIMAVIGGLVMAKSDGESKYQPVEATITEVLGISSVDETKHDVKVTYVVEGQTYEVETMSEKETEGEKITIYYEVGKPENVSTDEGGGKLLPVVILVIGGVAIVGGVVLFVKGIKAPKDQLSQVDMSKFSKEEIEAVANNKEPLKEYYFHFNGKLNQSYVLETTDRKPVVTINCDKIGVLSKFKFTFKNELTGKETNYEVGHTTTVSTGAGSLMIPCKSTFKVNGQDVLKLIASMGYSIVSKIEGLKLNFDICHLGVVVASLEAGGVNIAKGKDHGALGNIPTQGVFTVKAKETDLDAIALIAFAVSRIEFF